MINMIIYLYFFLSSIYALTWNTNAQYPPNDLDCSKLLGTFKENEEDLPDVYCIG